MKEKLRPCYVNTEKALFHMWVRQDERLVKFNSTIGWEKLKDLNNVIDELISNNVYDNHYTIEILRKYYGLVEFENGDVKLVKPESITFCDSKSIFEENTWN